MVNVETEIQKLLKEIGPGRMSSTAYDTAWVARLGEVDQGLSNQAMEWLNVNQLPDGSWGAKDIFYYHDRVISTLAAMIALTRRGRRAHDKLQIDKGLQALERITSGATQGLASAPNGATVGFEMIAPTLVAEAENLGIIKQQGNRILGRMAQMRARKMEKLAGYKISKYVTPAFSLEMVGQDKQSLIDIDNLQESNGSVSNSPSATAFFATYLKQGDEKSLTYLHRVVDSDGGSPDFAPIDVFEIAWTLWNLNLIPDFSNELRAQFTPFLEILNRSWSVDSGIGTAIDGTIKDGDDSGLVYDVLAGFGYQKDISTILKYEEDDFFRCFQLESNPSISTNIHILGALGRAGYTASDSSVLKILKFLRSSASSDGFWLDKWHSSPYYATSHAIIASHQFDEGICQPAIDWIVSSQQENGAWGAFDIPTAEETAYAVQALCVWKRAGNKVNDVCVMRGVRWLVEYDNMPHKPLWIGKALYCPTLVVRSAILSALELARQTYDK